jgi:hypothetical protein
LILFFNFPDPRDVVMMQGLRSSSSLHLHQPHLSLSTTSLSTLHRTPSSSLLSIARLVVAVHICQADNNITCMVPEFVHSVAAYMANAPQLSAYKDLLLSEPHIQNALSIRNCIQDPSKAFRTGVLEPLTELKKLGRIQSDLCVILVDSLNEAEFHKPDYGETVASFLSKHIMEFPPWLKCIVTVRTVLQDLAKFLPFHRIYLDREFSGKDIGFYIKHRLCAPALVENANLCTPAAETRFCSHVQAMCRSSFLFCKMLLDLIEQGALVLKSSNFKILPKSLAEIFLLQFNLKFPTIRSFEKVTSILNVCLATLYPLTVEEIYETVNSAFVHKFISWEEFSARMETLSAFLVRKQDSTYMFHHPAFREWLIRRDDRQSAKFLCDLRCVTSLISSNFLPR